MSGVDTKHPLYREHEEDWLQMRDTYRGQRRVKEMGFKYLPPTSGMELDGAKVNTNSAGYRAWDAYRKRAVFPEFVKEAAKAALGVMHNKPAVIELPAQLEPLREKATVKGESLQMLLRRMNEEQLVTGRLGLLAEVPTGPGEQQPYIAFYKGEDAINWDEGSRSDLTLETLNMVVLDESQHERGLSASGELEWELVRKYRVLILGAVDANETEGTYRVGVFREKASRAPAQGEIVGLDFNETGLIEPSIGGKKASELPFVFVNATDIVPEPDAPPMLGLSNLALTVYRGEADYRQALFMQGQDTLVTIGHQSEGKGPPEHRLGAGASIDLPIGGDAKFIGPDSAGLPEMRTALENDRREAGISAGKLIDDTSREKESGEALKVRVSARTATLREIALAGAEGLQEILRKIARWIGADDQAVKVTPNLDFTDDQMMGEELVQLMTAKTLGAPISMETVHKNMEERGMTEKTFEEEIEALTEEKSIDVLQPPEPATDEGSPEDNPGDGGSPPKKKPAREPAGASA